MTITNDLKEKFFFLFSISFQAECPIHLSTQETGKWAACCTFESCLLTFWEQCIIKLVQPFFLPSVWTFFFFFFLLQKIRYENGIRGCISEVVLAGELTLDFDENVLGTAHKVEPAILWKWKRVETTTTTTGST